MYSKGQSAPEAPNLKPLIRLAKEQGQMAFDLSKEQFEWAKQAYANDKTITDQVVGSLLKSMSFSQENAEKDRARYESIFQPIEDEFVDEAMNYDTAARRSEEMGRAQAGVAQQFDGAREAATRELESYGINPSATRFAALDLGARTAEAAAKAAAGTDAARYVEQRGQQLKAQAIDIGRGYPSQVNQSAGVGNQAGVSGSGVQLNQTGSGASAMGTGTNWAGVGMSGINTAGNLLNQDYANRLNAYKTQQEGSSGIGSLLGVGASLLTSGTGSIFGKILGFDKGGAVDPGVSPSRGAVPDDVPAALSVGEYVVPDDVVRWKGEEYFQRLVEKSREAKSALPVPQGKPQAALPLG